MRTILHALKDLLTITGVVGGPVEESGFELSW